MAGKEVEGTTEQYQQMDTSRITFTVPEDIAFEDGKNETVLTATNGYVYGMLFAIMSVLSVNFFFTYPYQDFNFSIEGYQVTFLGMFAIAIITSAMSSNMKEQAEQLAEQEKELMEAQKEKMRANLLRAVSHDLRTPLTGIIGNSSSYLEMGARLTDEEKRALVTYINKLAFEHG